MEKMKNTCPNTEYELIVDSAEQAIPRPKDYEEQKKLGLRDLVC